MAPAATALDRSQAVDGLWPRDGAHPRSSHVTDLLRVSTAGSVDDGKSTLIGRLLHDTRAVLDDQLAHLEATSRSRGEDRLDLSLLTDGLRAEREQGITIDVAYRYLSTGRRRFVIADTPGHVQYTRNMVTGASTADLALVLVDVRNGMTEQSRRHLSVAALLRIPQVVVAVNKMDLVGWSAQRFGEVCDELRGLAGRVGLADVTFVPVSALHGDNVVDPSNRMPWYDGPTLLARLASAPVRDGAHTRPLRLPVQWVIRPPAGGGRGGGRRRGYAGQLAAGTVAVGDRLTVHPHGPAGGDTTVTSVHAAGEPVAHAAAPQSVSVTLADHLDVSRGSLLADPAAPPLVGADLTALVCWMGEQPLDPRATWALKHTTRTVRARVSAVVAGLDLASGRYTRDVATFGPNDLGAVHLRASAPLHYDPYATDRTTGSFVLIDEVTGATVAAGMLQAPGAPVPGDDAAVDAEAAP